MNTVPTGFAGVPPSGPLRPVTETPHGDPLMWHTLATMDSATGALTAPCASSSAAGTPSTSRLARFEYTVTPRSKYRDELGTFVSRWATRPPVQDSATDTVSPRAANNAPTTPSSVSSSAP